MCVWPHYPLQPHEPLLFVSANSLILPKAVEFESRARIRVAGLTSHGKDDQRRFPNFRRSLRLGRRKNLEGDTTHMDVVMLAYRRDWHASNGCDMREIRSRSNR